MPDGTYLTAVKQTDAPPEDRGRGAVQHARVDLHAQHRLQSKWLSNPELEVVETQDEPAAGANFTLFADQVSTAADDAAKDKPARTGQGQACAPGERRRRDAMNIIEELQQLDPRDPGRWPLPCGSAPSRSCSCCSRCCCSYLLVYQNKDPQLEQKPSAEERHAARHFRNKHLKAVNLEVYKQQLEDIERSFGAHAAPAARQDRGAEACWSTSPRPASPPA